MPLLRTLPMPCEPGFFPIAQLLEVSLTCASCGFTCARNGGPHPNRPHPNRTVRIGLASLILALRPSSRTRTWVTFLDRWVNQVRHCSKATYDDVEPLPQQDLAALQAVFTILRGGISGSMGGEVSHA